MMPDHRPRAAGLSGDQVQRDGLWLLETCCSVVSGLTAHLKEPEFEMLRGPSFLALVRSQLGDQIY